MKLTWYTFVDTTPEMDTNQFYKNFGMRIRRLRDSQGLTQDELAKQIGISRASLANIEAGRQKVLVHHLFALANALDLESPAALLLPPRAEARRKRVEAELPLSDEGLTEKQRREVLSLMGDALNNNRQTDEREDG